MLSTDALGATDSDTVAITVNPVNDAPLITSNGGGNTAAVSVAENSSAVTTVASTDVDAQTPSYSIAGGADAALFTIDSVTGALSFLVAPNFETPADSGGNNVYDVTVQASDGNGGIDTQAIAVTVTNVNEAPVITSNGGGPAAAVSAAENQAAVTTVTSSDVDGGTPSWSIVGGADASRFTIDTGTGVLVFNTAPNYELTTDADGDNIYLVTVQVADGNGGFDTQAISVTVTNVNEAPVNAVPGAQTTAEDTVLVFSVANGNQIAVNDTEALFDPLQVTLGVSSGSLTLVGITGLSFSVGDGSGDATMTFTGSRTDINNALNGLAFAPAGNFNGAVTLQITTDDQGYWGSGGPQSDTDTVAINVTAANDAPSGAPVVSGSAIEDQTLSADTSSIADADGLGAFAYQWQRNGAVIAGATGSSYTLGDADVGTSVGVVVSYTDSNGSAESLTSAAVGPVANVNDAPSGAPAVTGSAIEDQTLSADTSSIADADGLGAYSYQWQRNGAAIAGATSSTYTLGDADVGTSVRVVVSYTDGHGTAESLTSTPVGPIANVNDAPSGAPVVTGTATEDQTLAADTSSIADGDGLSAFAYQWQRDGVAIAGATGSTFTLGDIDVGASIRVVVSYTDGNGTAESLTSAAVGPIANVNDAPSGAPVINGTATEDQTLAADASPIADADGLGAFAYQWQRNGIDIAGATGTSYTLGDADVGMSIRVVVSYTDGRGTAESVASAPVGPVANVNDAPSGAPVVSGTATEDQTLTADTSSIADADGLGAFSYQWQRDGIDIAGATASTYTLGDADVGTSIRVVVSYTDGNGTAESLTSAAVGPIANVNDAPRITSDGGGASALLSIAENQTAVTTVASADVDGAAPSYSIAGGADAARFAIDAAAGTLRFTAAPDFEAPSDADRDNVYQLVVAVADGNGGTDLQSIAVAVTGVNEAPGNVLPSAVSLAEQAPAGTVVAIVTASDPDAGDLFTFTLVNDGAGRFVIDPASGRLQVAPGARLDFESAPSHTLIVRVTDAQGLRTEQTIVVTLRDGAETMPNVGPPDVTPPPPPAPTPEPPPPAALPEIVPVASVASNERDRNADREPATTPSGRTIVDLADSAQDSSSRWQPQRGRSSNDGGPVLVASVSFVLDGGAAGGWSQGALDGLLLPTSETTLPRFGLFTLRGSSVEADSGDDAQRAAGRGAEEAVLAALTDPVRVASATLTAGFVWWLTRSGGLLTSILMGIPAWRHVDLLPVLAPARDDEDDEDDQATDSRDDEAEPSRQDSLIDELFSNTSRMFGESRYL